MATHMSHQTGESHSYMRWSRRTKGGRTIHYDLMVLQQPERARACGSGPKSSADRRPVDPPPIVRLLVSEGETFDQAKDITMDYNSDFFLFVSLENARPMAHGRVQTPAATSTPVLTGVPVSACCYLDRPQPAGYFLFPDLSVRHEGRYRLIFRLYERNKDPQDLSIADPSEAPDSFEDDDGLFFTFLNEVRSQPFIVYSAKKFPGLAESTPLSRTVAEQGCRVRIRRDVRMRRRETKGSAPTEYEQREEEFARDRRTQSPADAFRRSSSNSSLDRRPSGYEHQPALAPNQRVLNFGQPAYNKPYQHPPGPPSEPPSPASRTPTYRHGSFAMPNYHPSTPTYSHPYSDRPPAPAHEERRPSLPYPSLSSQSYGTPIQPRPPIPPPINTSFGEPHRAPAPLTTLPPMKFEQSPIVASLPTPPSSCISQLVKKRSLADYKKEDDAQPILCYKRAGGNGAEKHAPGYVEEMHQRSNSMDIDPRLRVDDDRDEDMLVNARKRGRPC